MNIAVGMHQDQGAREYQQDAMSIKHFGSIGVLAILADGMGGYEGGEIASRLVSETFREFVIEGEDISGALERYLRKGNSAIGTYKETHPEVKNMGTTAIAFFMAPQTCQWVSVGDSPLYLIRNRSAIKQINQNHSIAGLLDLQVKAGEITYEEAQASPQRHMLTSAVSGDAIPQIDVSAPLSIDPRDIYILASDGIETLSKERILQIVLEHVPVVTQASMQRASEALVDAVIAERSRNQDNVTVILLGKIQDDEPSTASYRASDIRKKRIKLWGIAAGLLATALAMLAYFLSGIASDVPPHKPAVKASAGGLGPTTLVSHDSTSAEPRAISPDLTTKRGAVEEETTKTDELQPSDTQNNIQTKPTEDYRDNRGLSAEDPRAETEFSDTPSNTLPQRDEDIVEANVGEAGEKAWEDSDRIVKQLDEPVNDRVPNGSQQPSSRPEIAPIEELTSDNPKIRRWMQQARQGSKKAQFDLGYSYYNGENGLAKDIKKGMEWYKRSAEVGYPDALNALGYAYQLKKQYKEAIDLYYRVVLSKDASPRIKKEAQEHLSGLCERFRGLCRD